MRWKRTAAARAGSFEALRSAAVAVILDVDEYEDRLDLHDPAIKAASDESRRQFEAGKGRPIEEFFRELETELVGA